MEENKLIVLIKEAIDIQECSVEIEGTTNIGEGFASDIIFAKVILQNNDNQGKTEIYVAVKLSKSNSEFRQAIIEGYRREVNFYNHVVPIFEQLQKEKNIKVLFNALPHCYKGFLLENQEILVFENLRKRGYELHPKRQAMNIEHIKLNLKNYAKFHALSLALRDQKSDIYNKIKKTVYNLPNVNLNFFEKNHSHGVSCVIDKLNEMGRNDLAQKYKTIMGPSPTKTLGDFMEKIPEIAVITHGDCHIYNFLIKYQDNQKKHPSQIALLDFQMSRIHSPMSDVAYFLYSVSSKKELCNYNELMEFYYEELSSFLCQLGTDPNVVFPKSQMWEHFKKYAFYGFFLITCFLKILYVDEEQLLEFSSFENDRPKFFSSDLLNLKSDYEQRLLAIVEHYFNIISS